MKFPIIATHNKQGVIQFISDLDSLELCTPSALKYGFFGPDTLLIDSASNGYRIQSVERIVDTKKISTLIKEFFSYRTIKIKLHFTTDSPHFIALNDVKNHLLEIISKDEGFWLDDPGNQNIKTDLKQSQSIEDIIHLGYFQ